ncbi:MAG: nucleotidyltransferase family protein [Oscillospiraceae bacterium]|nr:nucleotidyltransferase family protein [Oscillospiraceae bacterium]
MRAVGIVCEYNPFHRGHQYLIEACRDRLGSDAAVVCAMSGDFVQRGEAALFDKFTRAGAACRAGADLVVELPLPWCLSSAEGFASGAVAMLAALGCDTLAFGSESGDGEALDRLAAYLVSSGAITDIRKRMDADASLSFARARQLSAQDALGDAALFLNSPNDILGVEYLKAIKTSGADMKPLVVRREGGGHDSRGEGAFCSAMQLREMIQAGKDPAAYIPAGAMAVYRSAMEAGKIRDDRLLETALLSRLYSVRPEAFDKLPDAGGGAGRRLYKAVLNGGGMDQIVAAAGSKRLTAARMRRMLLCAALGLCAEDTKGAPPCLRILAADEKGRALLRERGADSPIPVLTRPAAVRALGGRAERIFTIGADAHNLYSLGQMSWAGMHPDADWRRNPIIVKIDEKT